MHRISHGGEVGDIGVDQDRDLDTQTGGKHAGKVTKGVFTYVALGEGGHPRELPAERAE